MEIRFGGCSRWVVLWFLVVLVICLGLLYVFVDLFDTLLGVLYVVFFVPFVVVLLREAKGEMQQCLRAPIYDIPMCLF